MSNSDFSITSSDDESDSPRRVRSLTPPPRSRRLSKSNCSIHDLLKPFIIGLVFFYLWNKLNWFPGKDNLYCNE